MGLELNFDVAFMDGPERLRAFPGMVFTISLFNEQGLGLRVCGLGLSNYLEFLTRVQLLTPLAIGSGLYHKDSTGCCCRHVPKSPRFLETRMCLPEPDPREQGV